MIMVVVVGGGITLVVDSIRRLFDYGNDVVSTAACV